MQQAVIRPSACLLHFTLNNHCSIHQWLLACTAFSLVLLMQNGLQQGSFCQQ